MATSAGKYVPFAFHYSSDLNLDVAVHVSYLERANVGSLCRRRPVPVDGAGAMRRRATTGLGSAAGLLDDMVGDELYVTVQVLSGGVSLHSVARSTKFSESSSEVSRWDEWLMLPVKYRDLPRTAQLEIKLWDVGPRVIAGSTVRLFDERLRLKRGLQKITMWPTDPKALARRAKRLVEQEEEAARDATPAADVDRGAPQRGGRGSFSGGGGGGPAVVGRGSTGRLSTSTAGAGAGGSAGGTAPHFVVDEKFRLMKLREQFERGEMPRAEYLDRSAMRAIDSYLNDRTAPAGVDVEVTEEDVFLFVEFPYFEHPVVFNEVAYEPSQGGGGAGVDAPGADPTAEPVSPRVARMLQASRAAAMASAAGAGADGSGGGGGGGGGGASGAGGAAGSGDAINAWNARLTVVFDPEVGHQNPVENKYHKLARGLLRGLVDKDLKPNTHEREQILRIVTSPDSIVDPRDAELLWKFRYSLTSSKKALTKFLACVDWNDDGETKQATELLALWTPIDIDDALKLLSSDFTNRMVRGYAVQRLESAADADLETYLLQLVQALRFEPDLAGDRARATSTADGKGGDGADGGGAAMSPPSPGAGRSDPPLDVRKSPLAHFLIERATTSRNLASYLNWYLVVETEDNAVGDMFHRVHREFMAALRRTPVGQTLEDMLAHQMDLITKIEAAGRDASAKGNLSTKIAKLNKLLSHDGAYSFIVDLPEPVVMPLNPDLEVLGIVPGKCSMFKSKLTPLVVRFRVRQPDDGAAGGADGSGTGSAAAGTGHDGGAGTRLIAAGTAAVDDDEDGGASEAGSAVASSVATSTTAGGGGAASSAGDVPSTYSVIFKHGDDMRQDQLIMQMIRLMDHQFKRVNLDLKLSPYRVLATSTNTGVMELVLDSVAVSAVLSKHNGNILKFFAEHYPDPHDADFGVQNHVMDTYVKSLAGYCVITYLLGIGDRHLDNIMLKPDGHLFHIDFGFIFGRDPKPYPAPMRLTKEMVEAMGGPGSPYFRKYHKVSHHYREFQRKACQAYNIMRKSAHLVLNLLRLMRGAGIEDLSVDPDTTLAKLQEKFKLDISDEEAEHSFLQLVDESVSALFPAIFEQLHKIAVIMR